MLPVMTVVALMMATPLKQQRIVFVISVGVGTLDCTVADRLPSIDWIPLKSFPHSFSSFSTFSPHKMRNF